jgi:hypothetical protein
MKASSNGPEHRIQQDQRSRAGLRDGGNQPGWDAKMIVGADRDLFASHLQDALAAHD